MLSYSKSALVGAILETLAYGEPLMSHLAQLPTLTSGLYLSYFMQGLQIILSRQRLKGIPSIRLLLTSLVLFFLITMVRRDSTSNCQIELIATLAHGARQQGRRCGVYQRPHNS